MAAKLLAESAEVKVKISRLCRITEQSDTSHHPQTIGDTRKADFHSDLKQKKGTTSMEKYDSRNVLSG